MILKTEYHEEVIYGFVFSQLPHGLHRFRSFILQKRFSLGEPFCFFKYHFELKMSNANDWRRQLLHLRKPSLQRCKSIFRGHRGVP